jgi:glycosyltransferase involved in cell wall biosynthesis
MKVLMLSWEYPPKIVGGIARHVEEIAWAMAAQGIEVHVVTCEFPGAAAEEVYNGVHIHRVTPYTPTDNFIHWVHQLNAAMRDRSEALLREWTAGKTDLKKRKGKNRIVIHAHDWLAHFAANSLKHQFHLPMIATIHATEYGRNNGIHTDIQKYIHSVECELANEAWRVIVCSNFMKREVEVAQGVPWAKSDVIPNGVHAQKFEFEISADEAAAFRAQYCAPEEKLVFFVGRMVREKGASVLVESLPKVRAQYHDAKLIIVGGGFRDHLVEQAKAIGMERHVYFAGFVPDDVLLRLYKVIDVAVFPSLYEPFGIVALEAMAAGVPVVVSDAGGLPDVVEHEVTGTVTWAGDSDSLAWGIVRALKDPGHAQWMAENAKQRVHDVFNWDLIAKQTTDVYERVWDEYGKSDW